MFCILFTVIVDSWNVNKIPISVSIYNGTTIYRSYKKGHISNKEVKKRIFE